MVGGSQESPPAGMTQRFPGLGLGLGLDLPTLLVSDFGSPDLVVATVSTEVCLHCKVGCKVQSQLVRVELLWQNTWKYKEKRIDSSVDDLFQRDCDCYKPLVWSRPTMRSSSLK